MGIARTREEAVYKGLIAQGSDLKDTGSVLFTIRNSDKAESVSIAQKFAKLGFTLYATGGTKKTLEEAGLKVIYAKKSA